MSNTDSEVQKRLKSITNKVRDIEANNAVEIRALQDKLDEVSRERDTLQRRVGHLQQAQGVSDQALRSHEESAKKLRVELQMAESSSAVGATEQSQLQQSLGRMEGLLSASRDKARQAEAELGELQHNYEARIEELEAKVASKDKELRKSKASVKELKGMVSSKSEEVAALQDIVRRECLERTQLKEELGALQSLQGGTVFEKS